MISFSQSVIVIMDNSNQTLPRLLGGETKKNLTQLKEADMG